MKLGLYWSYATRSLVRGGQRTILAVFCVAVGVMAIVALQLVGASVNQALVGNVAEANGGDIRVNAGVAPLRPGDLALFNSLKQQGRITDYATGNSASGTVSLASGGTAAFNVVAVSSNFPLIGQASFVAPSSNLTIQQVVNGQNVAMSSHVYQELEAHIGSTYRVKLLDGRVIPIVVAAEFQEGGAFQGPQIVVAQNELASLPGPNGSPLPSQFSTIYTTVPSANINSVQQTLSQDFPSANVITSQDLLKSRQSQVDQIRLFLRIVGLIALFIGGIGIINTMQVLLRRRQVEIAMLKTTGYRQVDLYGLFGLEAALLGLIGGIVGTAAGIGASYLVRTVVEHAFTLHLPIVLDWFTIGSGCVIGLSTALIFGLLPIVQASQIRPLSVLREGGESVKASSWVTTIGLLVLLSILFVALATSILGDLITAITAVYGGAIVVLILALGLGLLVLAISKLPVYERPDARMLLWILSASGIVVLSSLAFALLSYIGTMSHTFAVQHNNSTVGIYILAVLGGLGIVLVGASLVFLLATLLDAFVMFLPRAWKTPVMLAYRNMGRQRVRTTTTLTALFVGIFAIGLVLVLGQGIQNTINDTLSTLFTRNVFVVVSPRQSGRIATRIPSLKGVDTSKTEMSTVVPRLYPLFINGQDVNTVLRETPTRGTLDRGDVASGFNSIQGFDVKQGGNSIPGIVLSAGRNLTETDAGTNNVLVNARLEGAPLNLRPGNPLIIQSADGKVTKVLTIVGFYDNSDPTKNPIFGSILADKQVAEQLGSSSTLTVFSLRVDPEQLPGFKQSITTLVPTALVFSVVDIDALINQVLDNLIIMLTTLASLAMIAGIVIIANAVGLAMLERQREIGILKSVGYTSRSILATVLIENALVGFLGSLVAMLLVAGAITVLSKFVLQITLSIGVGLIALIVGVTIVVTMLVAMLVSWRATRIKPIEVLRYE